MTEEELDAARAQIDRCLKRAQERLWTERSHDEILLETTEKHEILAAAFRAYLTEARDANFAAREAALKILNEA